MCQIEKLQRRIIVAMERIDSGVEALQVVNPAGGVDETSVSSALEDERLANVQLEERLKTLKENHAREIDALRSTPASDGEADALRKKLAEVTSQLASVEAARAELAEVKAALENNDEVAALKAEIETLRSLQGAADEAETLRSEVERLTPIADGLKKMEAELTQLRAEVADSERMNELSAELEMLRAERASHGAAMSRLDDDLQRLRSANEQLRNVVGELKAAAEGGVADAEMVNRATAAELEATRAARASDAAEAHAVLARLEPLLTHAQLVEGEME